jgi:hypothetical protein
MIHEEAEKTISNPKPEDISILAERVRKAVLERGALPESITIQSEYISERSLLRATAMGNVSLDIGTANAQQMNDQDARVLACELFGINDGLQRIYDTKNYHIFACEISKKRLFLKSTKQPVLILDKYGRLRLSVDNAAIIKGSPDEVADEVDKLLRQQSDDGSNLAPQVHILDGVKLMDFSSLTSPEHVSKAVRAELKKVAVNDVAAIVRLG